MCIASLCGCAWLATSITFMVYCGIYAFNNPEPQAYYVPGTTLTEPQLIPITSQGENYGIVAIHDQFVMWFTWMFYNMCAFLGLGCCFAPIATILGIPGCARLGFCLANFSVGAVYVMGMVWRFGEAGKFASGDDDIIMNSESALLLQESNGKFLSIYYLITWIFIGLCAVCACLGCIFGAINSRSNVTIIYKNQR